MGTSSDVEHIKAAKSTHKCSWCGEKILPGESYSRWRWYDSGEAMTCKLHEECFKAHSEEGIVSGDYEFNLYDNPRGIRI